jgi:hypothetical protein
MLVTITEVSVECNGNIQDRRGNLAWKWLSFREDLMEKALTSVEVDVK